MSRERELLQRIVDHIWEGELEIVDYIWEGELVDEIKELLAQPEQRLTPLTPKLISLGNNCHESFVKGVKFAEAMHGIGGGE